MGVGVYLTFGILMLVFIPVTMMLVGSAFEETINASASYEEEAPNVMVSIGNWFKTLGTFDLGWFGEYTVFEGFFASIGNMFLGYSIFTWYINFVLTALPVILIIRGIMSTSG